MRTTPSNNSAPGNPEDEGHAGQQGQSTQQEVCGDTCDEQPRPGVPAPGSRPADAEDRDGQADRPGSNPVQQRSRANPEQEGSGEPASGERKEARQGGQERPAAEAARRERVGRQSGDRRAHGPLTADPAVAAEIRGSDDEAEEGPAEQSEPAGDAEKPGTAGNAGRGDSVEWPGNVHGGSVRRRRPVGKR